MPRHLPQRVEPHVSVILIFFVLPLLFTLLDGFVRVTSYKIGFYRGDQSERPAAASPASN